MKTKRYAAAVLVCWSLALAGGSSQGGTISYVPITGDADSGIDSASFYTHAVDFGRGDPAATVNGVAFQRMVIGDLPGVVDYGVTSGSRSDHAGNGSHNVSGSMVDLMTDMIYNGGNAAHGIATLSVTGLVPGRQYDARIYTRQWGPGGTRTATVGFDATGDSFPDDQVFLNQDDASANPPGLDASNRAYALSYAFTAEASTLRVSFNQDNPNWSWHIYGLTVENTGGAAATVANPGFEAESLGVFPGYVDGNRAITGWTVSDVNRAGVNDADGPFVNGQVIPEGSNVGFLQQANTTTATMRQRLFDLEPGTMYTLQYLQSERGNSAAAFARGFVTLGGQTIVPEHDVVRKDNRFVRVVSEPFTVAAPDGDLVFGNVGGAGDNTLLIDDIRLTRAVPRVANGGFEEPAFAGAGWSYTPAGAAWDFASGSGIAANGSPWVNNGPTLEGRQAGYIQGQSGFEQALDGFERGVAYQLVWDENYRAGQGGPNPYRVLIDGVQVFAAPASGVSNGWMTRSVTYVPHADGQGVLRFESIYDAQGMSGDRSSLVDDVHFSFLRDNAGVVPVDPAVLGLRPTGIDAGGDNVDDHYALTMTPSGGPGTAYVSAHPAWLADSAESRWLSPAPNGADNVAPGEYVWETTFDAGLVHPETLSITGRFVADNQLLDVLVNDQSTGVFGGGFSAWTTFQLNGPFVPGLNSLKFVLQNGGASPSPAGFRVEYLSALAVVPEPSTLVLAGLSAVLGLVAPVRRRRRAGAARGADASTVAPRGGRA